MLNNKGDEHLETPQISRFNHENNVFGLSFKESLKVCELCNSIIHSQIAVLVCLLACVQTTLFILFYCRLCVIVVVNACVHKCSQISLAWAHSTLNC